MLFFCPDKFLKYFFWSAACMQLKYEKKKKINLVDKRRVFQTIFRVIRSPFLLPNLSAAAVLIVELWCRERG